MLPSMRYIRPAVMNCVQTQKRFAGGFFKKNIWVEENSGIREASYKTWEFDTSSLSRLLAMFILPSILFYTTVVEESKKKHKALGLKVEYGIMP
mmetsp:Transcript_9503/g.9558  ORF Transcript_9503/g.9558 Transcript_9503/m.9558 type:complete len:94 (+) Transcript_9503:68-349(+)